MNPSKPVLETTVPSGSTINFGGRGWRDGSWLSLHNTATSTPNLVVLKNGDQAPSSVTSLSGGIIAGFLNPYMDPVTKVIRIGEHDLIVLVELGQTSPFVSGFDLQDLVILVTFD